MLQVMGVAQVTLHLGEFGSHRASKEKRTVAESGSHDHIMSAEFCFPPIVPHHDLQASNFVS